MTLELYTVNCPATMEMFISFPRIQQGISHFSIFQHLQ